MESKTVVKWSWVAVQETFNRKCLPPMSLLHPLFNVGVPFFKCQSTWQHWRAEGTGGGNGVEWDSSGWSMASFTTTLFSLYRKAHYPWTTSMKHSVMQIVLPYITRKSLVRARSSPRVAISFSFAGLLSDSLSMLLDVLCCQVGCLSAEKKT